MDPIVLPILGGNHEYAFLPLIFNFFREGTLLYLRKEKGGGSGNRISSSIVFLLLVL